MVDSAPAPLQPIRQRLACAHHCRQWTRPRGKTVALTVDLKTFSGFPLSVLRPSNWHLFKAGNIRKE